MTDRSFRLATIVERLAELPAGVTGDARVTDARFQTMRFANSRVHQPHLEEDRAISLRLRVDDRIATATSTDLSPDGFRKLVRAALALARVAPKEPKFPGFPADGTAVRPVSRSSATARISVEQVAKLAAGALDAAQAVVPEARVSGAVNVGTELLLVANSSGLARSSQRTVAQASVLVERLSTDPPGSGWAEGADWDATRLDAAALGREAALRVPTTAPEPAPPGKYRVVLRAPAVSELLSFLGYLGFNGHGDVEGWSCLGKLRDRKIAPPSITITDDGRSPAALPQSIDFEGLAKHRRALVEEGIARGPTTDLITAGRLGVEPTGHAVPPESPWGEIGPVPAQMIMKGGDAREAELIRETRRGILVTRFHYVRVVHPARSIITGMTRDGTYLIEKGEVTRPVRNLRFTESVLETLRGAEMIGRTSRRCADERGFFSVTCPDLLSRAFRFTSATLF